MKPKTIKIIYWAVTILFALFMGFGAVNELVQTPSAVDGMKQLGYPAYLNIIIGVAKIIGIISILQCKWKTLKEWAYAGFAIDIIGAGASMYFTGAGIGTVLFISVFLVWMFASYFLWKKVDKMKK